VKRAPPRKRPAPGWPSRWRGVVGELVEQMETIDRTSRRITDVIGAVEGVAFQTNMLALNAAVEAARAGEQGRGFAVVAGEVRLLAGRASAAAREIKKLADDTVSTVSRGGTLATDARRTISELTEAVSRADQVFHSPSADTLEHAEGIGALRDALLELITSTQRNLEVAQQSRDISGSLARARRRADRRDVGLQVAKQRASLAALAQTPRASPARQGPDGRSCGSTAVRASPARDCGARFKAAEPVRNWRPPRLHRQPAAGPEGLCRSCGRQRPVLRGRRLTDSWLRGRNSAQLGCGWSRRGSATLP